MRNQWRFQYKANDVATAAERKRQHHSERLVWWKQKQNEVMEEVRSKGLEIEESISSQYSISAAVRGAQIVVKSDYQQNLNECHAKIALHSSKEREYDGWVQFLSDREGTIELDSEDYLFFFGEMKSVSKKER